MAKRTPQPDTEDLAALLSKVLNHPELPTLLANDFGESMCELFNGLSHSQQRKVENDPAHIALLLAATAENAEGGAR